MAQGRPRNLFFLSKIGSIPARNRTDFWHSFVQFPNQYRGPVPDHGTIEWYIGTQRLIISYWKGAFPYQYYRMVYWYCTNSVVFTSGPCTVFYGRRSGRIPCTVYFYVWSWYSIVGLPRAHIGRTSHQRRNAWKPYVAPTIRIGLPRESRTKSRSIGKSPFEGSENGITSFLIYHYFFSIATFTRHRDGKLTPASSLIINLNGKQGIKANIWHLLTTHLTGSQLSFLLRSPLK